MNFHNISVLISPPCVIWNLYLDRGHLDVLFAECHKDQMANINL